jgi:two-component system, cell cycle response regulator
VAGADLGPVDHLCGNRRAGLALLLVTAALVLCAVEYTLHLSDGLRHALNYWVYNTAMLAAAAVILARGLARNRPDRLAWLLLASAVAAWGIGDTIWVFTVADDPNAPFPSLADAWFLAVYPPAYVGLLLLITSRAGTRRVSIWLDGVIGGLAVASVGTAVVFEAVLRATGGSRAAVATNLAYPLADLTLIALVVWALAVTGWRPGRTWGLIAGGLLVFSLSDCLYLYQVATGTYVYGSATDVGWLAGGVLLAWAAWQRRSSRVAAEAGGWGLLVPPAAFGLAALAVLVYDHFHRVHALSLVLAGTAIAAVIARMALTFAENLAMLGHSRAEARTDPLTGLGNRRRLFDDLETAIETGREDILLGLFDLNGFKFYNDSYGHPAGDALLARLGNRLAAFVVGRGTAYRMGGDEFCIAVAVPGKETTAVLEAAAHALAEHGRGFSITAAYGGVRLLAETATPADALRLADQRMYANKQSARVSAGEQSTRVLLRALSERYPDLGEHADGVADLAEAVARELGLPQGDVANARLTAALHDIGKVAIPDSILSKNSALEQEEQAFIRRHTLIGERILLSAPALEQIASLVRSSHERFDGSGYPDGLAGEEIPLASRIAFVCDAFDAMTSERAYGEVLTPSAAIRELERHAGRQFDPDVVAAFARALSGRPARTLRLAS